MFPKPSQLDGTTYQYKPDGDGSEMSVACTKPPNSKEPSQTDNVRRTADLQLSLQITGHEIDWRCLLFFISCNSFEKQQSLATHQYTLEAYESFELRQHPVVFSCTTWSSGTFCRLQSQQSEQMPECPFASDVGYTINLTDMVSVLPAWKKNQMNSPKATPWAKECQTRCFCLLWYNYREEKEKSRNFTLSLEWDDIFRWNLKSVRFVYERVVSKTFMHILHVKRSEQAA